MKRRNNNNKRACLKSKMKTRNLSCRTPSITGHGVSPELSHSTWEVCLFIASRCQLHIASWLCAGHYVYLYYSRLGLCLFWTRAVLHVLSQSPMCPVSHFLLCLENNISLETILYLQCLKSSTPWTCSVVCMTFQKKDKM